MTCTLGVAFVTLDAIAHQSGWYDVGGAAGRHRVRGKDSVPLSVDRSNPDLKNSFLLERADTGRDGKELT